MWWWGGSRYCELGTSNVTIFFDWFNAFIGHKMATPKFSNAKFERKIVNPGVFSSCSVDDVLTSKQITPSTILISKTDREKVKLRTEKSIQRHNELLVKSRHSNDRSKKLVDTASTLAKKSTIPLTTSKNLEIRRKKEIELAQKLDLLKKMKEKEKEVINPSIFILAI